MEILTDLQWMDLQLVEFLSDGKVQMKCMLGEVDRRIRNKYVGFEKMRYNLMELGWISSWE